MPRIYPLFSSSKGNCTYIGTGSEGILIDCGVSYTRIKNALAAWKIDINTAVSAVLVTHTHGDHVSGLKVLSSKLGVPVYASGNTASFLVSSGTVNEERISVTSTGTDIRLKGCTALSFPTSHDVECCGYRINFGDGRSCAVCTDLGYVSDTVRESLYGCSAVLIESNYDRELMRAAAYPAELKARICSDRGHLSNNDCGELCAELIPKGTVKFILGHISRDTNTPEKALSVNRKILAEKGYEPNRDYIMITALPENNKEFVAF